MNKTIFLLLGAYLLAPAAMADTRDDVLAGIGRCGPIRDDRTWLDCVYGAQQPMRAKLNLPPAPDFQQRLVPPAASMPLAMPRDDVPPPAPRTTAHAPVPRHPGFFATVLGTAPPTAISRMTDYRFDKTGAFIVTLENGQTWRQTDPGAEQVNWNKAPSAYEVTIIAEAFGSYSLKVNDIPRLYKVERLRR
jgi:hypothetical protein